MENISIRPFSDFPNVVITYPKEHLMENKTSSLLKEDSILGPLYLPTVKFFKEAVYMTMLSLDAQRVKWNKWYIGFCIIDEVYFDKTGKMYDASAYLCDGDLLVGIYPQAKLWTYEKLHELLLAAVEKAITEVNYYD